MQKNNLPMPMSLRTEECERSYQMARQNGGLLPLSQEPTSQEWEHWKLIKNRFPYTVAFKQHDMLIPKREVAGMPDLTVEEMGELMLILNNWSQWYYDMWFVNNNRRRSILSHFHIHLVVYVDSRKEMQL